VEEIRAFIETCMSWPAYPASLLMLVICLYWILVILGALDFDGMDFDIDLDSGTDSVLGLGWVGLRSLNLGTVPLIIWMTVFGTAWWIFAAAVETGLPQDDWQTIIFAITRDVGVAVLLTKLITQPMRGKFEHKVPNPSAEMIGKTCLVTSSEVTPKFGQAEYETEASPLTLHVRSDEPGIGKGAIVELVSYDSENHVYHVKLTDPENK
jgi:hypothetical protein